MSEKTDEPSPKKLADARERGEVARSKDASKAILIWGLFGYVIFFGPKIVQSLTRMIDWAATNAYQDFDTVISEFLRMALATLVELSIPLVLIVLLLGIVGEITLTGGMLFATEKLEPNLKNFNVVNRVKEMFSPRNLVEAIKSVVKIVALSWILVKVISANLEALILIAPFGIYPILLALSAMLSKILIATGAAFTALSIFDMVIQRLLFMRDQRMTKDEVKREYKETEGSPEIKQRQRELFRELSNRSARFSFDDSTAVIVNPVHYAVAVVYVPGRVPVPVVSAKGHDQFAREIVEEARRYGIPVVENVPIARSLYADAEVDECVPDHLIEAVLAVLSTVERLAPR